VARSKPSPAPPPVSPPPPVAPPAPPADSCATCRHFQLKGEYAGREVGLCRRHPPTLNVLVMTPHGPLHGHPVVAASDGCGEFTART
jgi:hypothetical protein